MVREKRRESHLGEKPKPEFRNLYVVLERETGGIYNCFTSAQKAATLAYKLMLLGIETRVRIIIARDLEKAVAQWSFDYTEYKEANAKAKEG